MKLYRKLRHGLIMIAAVSVMSLFMTGKVHSEDKPVLTPEYLASNTWGPFDNGCGNSIKFTKNGRFNITEQRVGGGCQTSCEDTIHGAGNYKISGDKVILTFDDVQGCGRFRNGDSITGILTNENPVKYRWCLDFNKYYLWVYNHNSLIKEGESVSAGKTDAISTGVKEGITTASLKVRETPSASGKEINFECSLSEMNTTVIKSLGKGIAITIFARTKEKDTVGKWKNYWYYVKYELGEDCSGNTMGWVFGEFVKIK